jgi:hypothetical protein
MGGKVRPAMMFKTSVIILIGVFLVIAFIVSGFQKPKDPG